MRFRGLRRPFRRAFLLTSAVFAALYFAAIAFAWDPTGQAPGITKEAGSMHTLYIVVLWMSFVVFIIVGGLIVYAAIRYKKRNDQLPPQFHGSTMLEFAWTGIPVAIVLFLFVYSFVVLQKVDHPSNSKNMQVEVEAFQFQWAFHYQMNELGALTTNPSDKYTFKILGATNEPTLVLPVDQPVQFNLHSDDVIHAFYVPDFLYKLDVIPGRDNHFTVTPTKVGNFTGQCAELCGINHSLMRFKVQVMSQSDFKAWITKEEAAAKKSQGTILATG